MKKTTGEGNQKDKYKCYCYVNKELAEQLYKKNERKIERNKKFRKYCSNY